MIGRVSQGRALMLLLLCAATTAIDPFTTLTIKEMDWSYVEETYSFLTVCTEESLLSQTYTLEITPNSEEYKWIFKTHNFTCANFSNELEGGKQPLPAEQTTYTLSSVSEERIQQTGSVAFSLEGAIIDCRGSQFLRFKLSNGVSIEGIDETECLPFGSLTSSACYVDGAGFTTDPVCFSDLDPDNSQLHVCVERTAFDLPDAPVDPFTADELKYVGGSFTFNFDNDDLSLAELLILSDETESSPTVVSCNGNTCDETSIVPSTASYNLCGVFVDTNGLAVNSGDAIFQDMDLKVDTVGPTVDFHFINKKDDGLYLVTGLNSAYASINEFSLDCSHITQDTICNGFFDANPDLIYIAVSYDNGSDPKSNTIIAQVTP